MPRPILVGYDPRRADHAPIGFGVALARLTGAPLIVAFVEASRPALARPLPLAEPVDADLVEDCSVALEQIVSELQASDVATECRKLSSTSAARALHEAAEREDAGALVVGSSRRSDHGRVLAGPTALRLLHGSPCSVAVVPQGWRSSTGFRTIGVGYADSDEARAALRTAHHLASRAGATLRVFTVVQIVPEMYLETEPTLPPQPAKSVEDVVGEYLYAVGRELQRIVAELGDDVEVEVDTIAGDPAEQLVQVSEHLDLLVCGSRGYGPLRGVLLGSVSARVVAAAHCPVLVLPRGARAALEAPAPDAQATAQS